MYFTTTEHEGYTSRTGIQCNKVKKGDYISLSKAFENCKSDESCIAVSDIDCKETKAQICYAPKTGEPFRESTTRKYCIFEKGN